MKTFQIQNGQSRVFIAFRSQYSSRHGMFDFNFSRNISDPLSNDNLLKYLNEKNYFSLGISRSKVITRFWVQNILIGFCRQIEKNLEDDFEQKIMNV